MDGLGYSGCNADKCAFGISLRLPGPPNCRGARVAPERGRPSRPAGGLVLPGLTRYSRTAPAPAATCCWVLWRTGTLAVPQALESVIAAKRTAPHGQNGVADSVQSRTKEMGRFCASRSQRHVGEGAMTHSITSSQWMPLQLLSWPPCCTSFHHFALRWRRVIILWGFSRIRQLKC